MINTGRVDLFDKRITFFLFVILIFFFQLILELCATIKLKIILFLELIFENFKFNVTV